MRKFAALFTNLNFRDGNEEKDDDEPESAGSVPKQAC
jgi:hypothetical protein